MEKMIWFSEFWRSGFSCEDPMLSHFHLQMLNDRKLKLENEACLKCKYQLRKIAMRREKMLQLIKSPFFEKWV